MIPVRKMTNSIAHTLPFEGGLEMTGAKSRGADALAMVNPGAAAIDIGTTMHMAAVNSNRDDNPVRALCTFTGDLHAMAPSRSEEPTYAHQSIMRNSYAVFTCTKKSTT